MKTKMYSNVGWLLFLLVCCCALPYTCFCYKPGDFVPMAIQTQYHSMRSPWEDVLGHHCPRFGIDKEIVLPIPKPTGYTGSDPYKIALQIGKEKFHTPWLFVIGRLGSEIPMIIVKLKYSAGDLQGAVVKLESMPQQYIVKHEAVMKNYWDINRWPKQILIQYQWEKQSSIDVETGLYVLFGSGFILTLITALNILQSSKEKVARFVKETVVADSSAEEAAKAE